MNKISADARSINQLLSKQKYRIDYYQREYQWGRKQIAELLEDLEEKFLENYEDIHELSNVLEYSHYFLGPSSLVSMATGATLWTDNSASPR